MRYPWSRGALLSALAVEVLLVSSLGAQQPAIADSVLQAGSVRLRYRISGTGPPLVLIHGFAGTADDLAALRRQLSPSRTTVSIEIRSFGETIGPLNAAGADTAVVEDIGRVMSHLHIQRADLVGFSMGAVLAARFAALHADRVRSLILISAAPMLSEPARAFWMPIAEDLETGNGLRAVIRAISPIGAALPTDSAIAVISRQVVGAHDPAAWATIARGMPTLSFTAGELGCLVMPVLVVYGAEDPLMQSHTEWVSRLPTSRVDTVAGANHSTLIRSTTLFQLVQSFLTSIGAPR